jgi:hypothetical protein
VPSWAVLQPVTFASTFVRAAGTGRNHGDGPVRGVLAGQHPAPGGQRPRPGDAAKAIVDYLNGGSWTLVEELVEVESGKRNDRPELAKALAACRVHGATLLIAKLDRLARNVAFISNLMQAGVEFVAVDFPQANRLTVHSLAAVAEHEHEMISARTKAALAASKARGVPLGNPANLKDRAKGTARSTVVRRGGRPTSARWSLPFGQPGPPRCAPWRPS